MHRLCVFLAESLYKIKKSPELPGSEKNSDKKLLPTMTGNAISFLHHDAVQVQYLLKQRFVHFLSTRLS